MKKSLWKNNFKSIIKTRRRFISILVMAFLGVGFFSGLVATSPDLLDSLDRYADENRMFDINIVSTLGLTKEDVDEINKIEGIEEAYGIQTKDSLSRIDEKESVCKVIEYNENINLPKVVYGRLPQNSNECLLDKGFSIDENMEEYIGKTVILDNNDKDQDDKDIFTKNEFNIVGIAESPIYISRQRGNTSIGNGSVGLYIYVNNDVINMDYYTEIDVIVKDAKEETTNSNKYLEIVNPVIKKVEDIKGQREEARYNSLVDEATEKVDDAQKEYDDKKEEAYKEFDKAQKKIDDAKDELEASEKKIRKSEKEIAKAKKEIKEGKKKLEDGKAEIEENEAKLKKEKDKADKGLKEAQEKIDDAKEKINEIKKGKWYINDRLDNTGYTNIFDAIQTMSNISKLFPVIFYIVAVLISLTSMTRMIEEERVEIGTLKSLGYNNIQIISKYVIYSLLACVIGGIIGMSVGLNLLPTIVWNIYSIIYTIPNFVVTYRLEIGLLGIVIAFICIGGATITVARKTLKEMPSMLMRPKPPKNGKKIILEKIKFFWSKLVFSQKVTVRNIFRYKKRAIMTVVGIAGCTGLMLTGFGIRDSIIDVPTMQFNDIFKYEISVSLLNTDGLDDLEGYINKNEKLTDYSKVYATSGSLKNNEKKYTATTFVPENVENFKKVAYLQNKENGSEINLNDNGIVITDKVADSLDVGPGDEITFIDGDDLEYKLKIEAITTNYVGHYVYMTKDFYEANIKKFKTNSIFINSENITKEDEDKILAELLNIDGVASASMITTLVEAIENMLSVMNYVVIILIVASALLAFVVLYNLANINIGERQREIATLKVLGFYDKEVDDYINKENIIFTIWGIIIGLIFGIFLTSGLIASIEIDNLRFFRQIKPLSYVYSATITIIFSLIVNSIIHFILKRIDMIESLKSVE